MAANNPAMVIRVAADLTTLKEQLKTGQFAIEETTNRMVTLANSYSGARTVQQANDVMRAIQEVGGASQLTAREQAQANRVIEEALDKYKAMGREAPAALQQLADETRQAEKATGGMTETVKQLALGFVTMATARAAYNFVKQTFDEAGALSDLSAQTRISVEQLQILAGAMSEFGVSQDELGRVLFGLSQKIAGGDESIERGLHKMGMTLSDVAGLEGQELFLKMQHGLAGLQGELRDTTAVDLYGERLGRAMAGASEGIDGAIDAWRRHNTVVSTESNKAMDEMAESIAKAERNMSALAANMIGPMAQAFNGYVESIKTAGFWASEWARAQDFLSGNWGKSRPHMDALLKGLGEYNQQAPIATDHTKDAAGAHQEVTSALDKRAQAAKFMAAMELETAAPLLDYQQKYLDQMRVAGTLNAENAKAVGVSAGQFKAYEQSVKDANEANKQAEETWKANVKATGEYDEAVKKSENLAIASARKIEEQNKKLTQSYLDITNQGIAKMLDAQVKLNALWGLDASGALQMQQSAVGELNTKLNDLHATLEHGNLTWSDRAAVEAEVALTEKQLGDAIYFEAKANDDAAAAAERHAAKTDTLKKNVGDLGLSFDTTTQSIASTGEALAALYRDTDKLNQEFGAAGVFSKTTTLAELPRGYLGPGQVVNTGFGAPIDPETYFKRFNELAQASSYAIAQSNKPGVVAGYQSGGPVAETGLAYLHAGEYVIPASGGPSTTINISVTQPLGTPQAIAEVVGRAVMQQLRNTGARFPSGA